MKLIIFGASGRTGLELIKQALDQQHTITAFVRDPDGFEPRHEQLTIVTGDITVYDEVERAIQGQEVVISALGPHTLLTRVPALVIGIQNIVRAMKATGVKRLLYLSALGVGESEEYQTPLFRHVIRPVLLGRDYADHLANEETIRASSLDWILIRPARLADQPHTGQYQVDLHLDASFPLGHIGRADVADFILKQLEDTRYLHQAPGLMSFKTLWYEPALEGDKATVDDAIT